MKLTTMIERLEELKNIHGDQNCYLTYDGSVIHLDGIMYASVQAERDVYTQKPKDSIYTGIFFNEYPDCTE